jgi:hypothetical protein
MHRSGTSAVGGALQLLGVDFGQRLFPPGPENEKGYWEHPEIVALHDELLRSLGSRWDDDKPLPSDWVKREITRNVRSRLIGILERDFAHSSLFGMKDPRMCRLMPLWFPIFQIMRLDPHFVLVVRHPWEVAESLAKRDAIEHPKSYILWLEHVVQAESATRSHERAFVCYEEMVHDPVAIFGKLRKQLGVNLVAPSLVRTSLRNFLVPSLRHHQLNKEADKLRQPVPKITLDVYETIRNASTSREIGIKMEPLGAQFLRGRELFYPRVHLVETRLASLDHEFEEKARHVTLLQDELKERSKQVVYFQHEVEEKSKQAAQFKAEAEERSRHAAQLQRDLEEKSSQMARLQRDSGQQSH